MSAHQLAAMLHVGMRLDCKRILGHHLPDSGCGGIPALDHDALHKIALGEDADQHALGNDRDRPDVSFDHQAGNFKYGLGGIGSVGILITNQVEDTRHVEPP
jgi:hypothetical protein